jgi:hypothetical protein
MKVGAEPKKLIILTGLMAVAGYLFYSNLSEPAGPPGRPARSTGSSAAQHPPVNRAALPQDAAAPAARPAARIQQQQRQSSNRRILQEFKPSLLTIRAEAADPSSINPTLRLDLLEKVQRVRLEGGARNLFQFGSKPLPKVEEKILPAAKEKESEIPKIDVAETKPAEPVKPPPPPIPLQFYGYASPAQANVKRAFFLDGDEILVAGEGELVKQRYKVIRIGINSVEMEDTQDNNRQTLRIVEQMG